MSHWEACSVMISLSFERFSEICHLPSENYKNQVLGFQLNFPHLFCIWHHVGLYHQKDGTISFSNMYDTYREHARSGDNVPENSREGVKNGNVDKIRRHQKKQKVHFFF